MSESSKVLAVGVPVAGGQAADLETARRLCREQAPEVIVLDEAAAGQWLTELAAQDDAPPVIVVGAGPRPEAFACVASAAELPAWLAAAARYRRVQLDLQRLRDQMVQQEKMAALGALVAGIAHDIHTPIGTITSNSDILGRSLSRLRELIAGDCCPESFRNHPDLVRVVKIVDEITRINQLASDRIVSIVRSLRNFARLDEAEVRETNLHDCLESTLTLVHHEFKNRIKIRKEFGDIPLVPCHANQINQVFMNLLVNASHAIQGSGEVTLRTSRDGPWVKVQVSDSGSGIPPENLARIFDAGFTTKGAGVGTGLGLAICQRIICEHNGSIAVESEVGKGTTFTVCLPIEWRTSPPDSDASQS
jgi:signal transduction histidine kinase